MHGNMVTLCGMSSFVMLSERSLFKEKSEKATTRSEGMVSKGVDMKVRMALCCIRKNTNLFTHTVEPFCYSLGLTVHPQWFLVPLPVGRHVGGVLLSRGLWLHLAPAGPAARAEAERPGGVGRAAGLLCHLAGCQTRLVQALVAVLGLQAPQAHLIVFLRTQRADLLSVHCEGKSLET